MFNYYFGLALRSLKRNVILTALMIAAIGVGIGASMTTLTVFRAMSGDPIPHKSTQLFVPQIDIWGLDKAARDRIDGDNLPGQLSHTDVEGLMNSNTARRQTAMYATALALTPSNPQLQPFEVHARAAYADFFPMFEVPFQYGTFWSAADDTAHAFVVVITRELNDKLFAGANSIGKVVNLNNHEYRVVGVMDRWQPIPRFYDLNDNHYAKSEDVFLPFTRAIEERMETSGEFNCSKNGTLDSGWDGLLRSDCVWFQFWVELPNSADAVHYRDFLDNYAAEQLRSGRFHWLPHTQLRDVQHWLAYKRVVSDEVRILVLVSLSFLLVCLLNAMGLMLAKITGRTADISVRRALGASRSAIFAQCLVEAGVVGLAGGVLGLALTALGLLGLRTLLSEQVVALSHLDLTDISVAVLLGLTATVVAGLYPTWRATQVQPAWQLKAR